MTDSNIREMVVLVLRVILAKDGHDLFFNLAKTENDLRSGLYYEHVGHLPSGHT